ncbi:hypothetical protein AHAS_Ahas15G0205300 [Arachis hypogaea]
MSTTLIIGVGYPPTNDNYQWFLRANPQNGEQIQLNLSVNINHFRFYSMIGSDNGNLCIRFFQDGLNFMLVIWNPLTCNVNYVSDEARKHCCHAVSLYAFGICLKPLSIKFFMSTKSIFSTSPCHRHCIIRLMLLGKIVDHFTAIFKNLVQPRLSIRDQSIGLVRKELTMWYHVALSFSHCKKSLPMKEGFCLMQSQPTILLHIITME